MSLLFFLIAVQAFLEGTDTGAKFGRDLANATHAKQQDYNNKDNDQFGLSKMKHVVPLSWVVPSLLNREGTLLQEKVLHLFHFHLGIIKHSRSADGVEQTGVLHKWVSAHCGVGMETFDTAFVACDGDTVNADVL